MVKIDGSYLQLFEYTWMWVYFDKRMDFRKMAFSLLETSAVQRSIRFGARFMPSMCYIE